TPKGQAGIAVPPMECRRQHQREQRKDEEDRRCRQVQERHESENQDRRERRNDELRQVLTKELIELLDAIDERQHRIAAAPLIEMARTEVKHMRVQGPTYARLHDGR